MAKRKRRSQDDGPLEASLSKGELLSPSMQLQEDLFRSTFTPISEKPLDIQIITGSYDRVLHGVIATLPPDGVGQNDSKPEVRFIDNFLFNAHESAIRCLAISPPSKSSNATESQKIILASGGTDEKINLYHISASPSPLSDARGALPPSLNGKLSVGGPKNKELGSLLHHSSNVNVLHFPTRSKLLSGAEDNTIAISRTRDWTVLSTIKAPNPRAVGQPSGDTAPPGTTVSGIVDFAVHPSMKLMISVGRGEKCMRLWNLVTGKKAGVLNFERGLLLAVGEGKGAKGEGMRVRWKGDGTQFVVGFQRGAAVFGMDAKPQCRILPSPTTKLHQMHYLPLQTEMPDVLVVSTEDGRLIFYSASRHDAADGSAPTPSIPDCKVIGQLGGKSSGISGRIKDFEILPLRNSSGLWTSCVIVTAGSDGTLRLWEVEQSELIQRSTALSVQQDGTEATKTNGDGGISTADQGEAPVTPQVGRLRGTYSTDNRITCIKAFLMTPLSTSNGTDAVPSGQGQQDSEEEFQGLENSD